jgi:hypothetical protein
LIKWGYYTKCHCDLERMTQCQTFSLSTDRTRSVRVYFVQMSLCQWSGLRTICNVPTHLWADKEITRFHINIDLKSNDLTINRDPSDIHHDLDLLKLLIDKDNRNTDMPPFLQYVPFSLIFLNMAFSHINQLNLPLKPTV